MNHVGGGNSRWALVFAVSFLALESAVAATPCFEVYDGRGNLKYEGRQAPVDLRDAESESWTKLRQRGEHLLWHSSLRCQRDGQQAARSTAGRKVNANDNAELLLSRIPSFAGR